MNDNKNDFKGFDDSFTEKLWANIHNMTPEEIHEAFKKEYPDCYEDELD